MSPKEDDSMVVADGSTGGATAAEAVLGAAKKSLLKMIKKQEKKDKKKRKRQQKGEDTATAAAPPSVSLKKLCKNVVKDNGDMAAVTRRDVESLVIESGIFAVESRRNDDDGVDEKLVSFASSSCSPTATDMDMPPSPQTAQEEMKLSAEETKTSAAAAADDDDNEGGEDQEAEDGPAKKKSKKSKKNNKEDEEGKKRKKDKKKEKKSRKKREKDGGDGDVDDGVKKWRRENKIVVIANEQDQQTSRNKSNGDHDPFRSFDDDRLRQWVPSELLRQCTVTNRFERPSPVQAQSWPILLSSAPSSSRQDMIGIAETGSGKTLAYALPALSILSKERREKQPRRRLPKVLVLAPTRELAMQIHEVLEEFGAAVGVTSLVVYGGVPKHRQSAALRSGSIDCVVATPGRLKDLLHDGCCDLSDVSYLVLDEADRMLDMGFEEDVRYAVSHCKPKSSSRQTAMFSATWPASVQRAASEYLRNDQVVRVYVGFESIKGNDGDEDKDQGGSATSDPNAPPNVAAVIDDSLSANKRVTQNVEVMDDRARYGRLKEILRAQQQLQRQRGDENRRVLVFALYKKEAERLEYWLRRDGYDVCSVHGNKNQHDRSAALSKFKSGTCPLMVATDVAARGLDIPNVEVVINYTFPLTVEDYVHRIGRTGRAGKDGISYTFFQPTDKSNAGALQQVIKQAGQEVPADLAKFGSTIKKKEHSLYGNFGPTNSTIPMKQASKITFDYSDDEGEG